MSTFDKREKGFESKFAHDEELRFKAHARRNKLVGLWAADKLGFTGAADGAIPYAGVAMDSAGNLYGATISGGASGAGVVYRLTPGSAGWQQSILYTFQGRPDGSAPYPTPVLDAAGNLYGTTNTGGANKNGIVFEVITNPFQYTVLYNFCSLAACADGSDPGTGLTFFQGNLYGTTSSGGANHSGTVFEIY